MEGPSDTVKFLRERFSSYYRKNDPVLPPRFGSREWAFFLWEGKGMFRHTAFINKAKLMNFMALKGPRHVYHSAAYYQRPGASTMGQKGWLGADLIFDIDADHIEGHEKMTYKQQLARVKIEIYKLVHEYLLGDMAFNEKDLSVVFSGGRGYHVHVRDPRVFLLNSHERKEIVDYIMATELEENKLYNVRVVPVEDKGPFSKVRKGIDLPRSDEGGWRGRFRNGIDKLMTDLEIMDKEDALKRIMAVEGIGKKTAVEIYRVLFEGKTGKRGVEKIRRDNTLEIFDNDKHRNALIRLVVSNIKVVAGEADAPVTKDVNRLIRLPGSLHGKSSLRVILLELDDIKDFEPLRDAVVFGDGPVKANVTEDVDFEVGGNRFKVKAGETELPEYAAIFLMARREAEILK